MKRFLCVLLTVVMLLSMFSFTGCEKERRNMDDDDEETSDVGEDGKDKDDEDDSDADKDSENSDDKDAVDEDKDASTDEDKDASADEDKDSSTDEDKDSASSDVNQGSDEIIVADKAEYLIKVTNIGFDEYDSLVVEVYLENRSSSATASFARYLPVVIDGLCVDATLYEEVKAGKSATAEMTCLVEEDVELAYARIDLSFEVQFDSLSDSYIEEVSIKNKKNASPYVRTPGADDIVLCENQYVKITYIGMENYSFEGEGNIYIDLYVENKLKDIPVFIMTEDDDEALLCYMELCPATTSYETFFITVPAGKTLADVNLKNIRLGVYNSVTYDTVGTFYLDLSSLEF